MLHGLRKKPPGAKGR